MSGISLRCATCGTTQSRPGECEACFEGEVRYFCSNHNPGLWINEPVCRSCGAKFGDATRTEPQILSRSTPAVPAPETRRAESRSPKSGGGVGPRPARPRRSPVGGEGLEEIPVRPTLADLLAVLAERTGARREREEVWTDPPAERASRGLPVMGCLVRLVVLIIVLIALVLAGLYGLLGNMIL